MDFAALPPDCAQSALATGAGSTTAVSASAGSTLMLASFDRIDTRSPTVGVLGPPPPLNTPQPASGRATSTAANRKRLFRSEEHTSELQSLMRISYAVFCLKQKTNK